MGAASEPYAIRDRLPEPETFAALRDATGMTARSLEGIEAGLPNSLFGAVAVHEPSGETVGMGRIVGDGGTVYLLSDIAVHPDHQGRGLGTQIVERLEAYLEREAPPKAYVTLIADVDGFYERFGYENVRPTSKGMYRRTK